MKAMLKKLYELFSKVQTSVGGLCHLLMVMVALVFLTLLAGLMVVHLLLKLSLEKASQRLTKIVKSMKQRMQAGKSGSSEKRT